MDGNFETPQQRRVNAMAEAMGVDLVELTLRGTLSDDALDDMVVKCTGCTQPCACDTWLDANGASNNDAPPSYCRNDDVFAALKDT